MGGIKGDKAASSTGNFVSILAARDELRQFGL